MEVFRLIGDAENLAKLAYTDFSTVEGEPLKAANDIRRTALVKKQFEELKK